MDESNRSLPEIPSQASPLTPDADWPRLMREAALSVLGEPAKCHRGEWRYRSRGSLVVHIGGPRAGRWWDFESGAGGGVLDFLEQFAGLDRAQALAWLPGRPALLPRRRTSHPTRPDTDARHRFDLARSRWASSKPIPPHQPAPTTPPAGGSPGANSGGPPCPYPRRSGGWTPEEHTRGPAVSSY